MQDRCNGIFYDPRGSRGDSRQIGDWKATGGVREYEVAACAASAWEVIIESPISKSNTYRIETDKINIHK